MTLGYRVVAKRAQPPTIDRVVSGHAARVDAACAQCSEDQRRRSRSRHLHGRRAVRGAAIAELTAVVISPAIGGAAPVRPHVCNASGPEVSDVNASGATPE